jgi:CBS domain-containing protein
MMSTINNSTPDPQISHFNKNYGAAVRAGMHPAFGRIKKSKKNDETPAVDRVFASKRTISSESTPAALKVRDIMSESVISVTPDASVHEVAHTMHRNGLGLVAVITADGRLRGVISEADLIQRAEIGTEPPRSWWRTAFRDAISASHDYVRSHGTKAHDVMTRYPVTTTADEPLRDVANTMARKRLRHMPVMSGERVIGIVTRSQIVRALATRSTTDVKTPVDSDPVVRKRVMTRIRSLPWNMTMHIANVTVTNGIAGIYGWVASNIERRALHVVVENTPGVREVEDYLHRTPPYV